MYAIQCKSHSYKNFNYTNLDKIFKYEYLLYYDSFLEHIC